MTHDTPDKGAEAGLLADGWIEWNGGVNPVPGQIIVFRTTEEWESYPILSDEIDWQEGGVNDDFEFRAVARYRLATPSDEWTGDASDGFDRAFVPDTPQSTALIRFNEFVQRKEDMDNMGYSLRAEEWPQIVALVRTALATPPEPARKAGAGSVVEAGRRLIEAHDEWAEATGFTGADDPISEQVEALRAALASAPTVSPSGGQEGALLDRHQQKAIERAAMDAGCTAWRGCRLAMVRGEEIVGYPAFSRSDMAEMARLYCDAAPASPAEQGEG